MAEMPRPAQPASPSQPSPAFRASKIANSYVNRFQKRALLLVRNGGSRPCRASRNDGFWHAFRTNATEVRAQKPSSDASKMVDSEIPSGSMQQRYEQKSRLQTRLKLSILTLLADQCNRGPGSKPTLRVARNGCFWHPVWTNATEMRPQNARSRLFLFLSAEL